MDNALPAIPAKRYFTIGEVSELCGVKPYVLRYWEQEFAQLKPMKRRGNRRYYQHHEVLLIRRIRELLYDQGFTISGARNRLAEADVTEPASAQRAASGQHASPATPAAEPMAAARATLMDAAADDAVLRLPQRPALPSGDMTPDALRRELEWIRELLR